MGTLCRRRCFLSAAFAFLLFAAALGTGLAGIVRETEETRLRPAAEQEHRERVVVVVVLTRRRLLGPGSSPPTCRDRCGRCFPCRPVLVVIQPSRIVPQNYYPEAWRCKCGNKLFMP